MSVRRPRPMSVSAPARQAVALLTFGFVLVGFVPMSDVLAMQRERAFGGGTVFPPESLDVLIDRSVLVIRGRVGSSRMMTRTDSVSRLQGYTYWEVQVLEVLKSDGALPSAHA